MVIVRSGIDNLADRLLPGTRAHKPAPRGQRVPPETKTHAQRAPGLMDLADRLPRAAQQALQRAMPSSVDVMGLLDGMDRPGTMDALDAALDLTPGRAGGLLETLSRMSPREADAALKSLAELLKRGVVGYEYRKVNGEPMKVFIDVAIGSDLQRAPLVTGPQFDRLF